MPKKKIYREVSRCRICGNRRLLPIINLGNQCLTGFFPKTKIEKVPSGPLELVKCMEQGNLQACGLVQLRHSFEPSCLYGSHYGYRSSLNKSMADHLRNKVEKIMAMGILRPGDLILDIGSNDGTLLSQYPKQGFTLVGIDPSAEKFKDFYPPHIRLYPDFFCADVVKSFACKQKAKVITSIAMFYDLEDPVEFMRQVHQILDDDGVWVLEQSYMPSMLELTSYDTICHEHLEYYGLKQMKWMAQKVGFRIIDLEFNDVNGGSFSVVLSKKKRPLKKSLEKIKQLFAKEESLGLATLKPYQEFAARASQHRSDLKEKLEEIKAAKKTVIGYGASTKGNVILQYGGFTRQDISCIAEVNKDKFGAFTPGTGIPIISEFQARQLRPDVMLVLPWHFRENIIAREQRFLDGGGKLLFPFPTIEMVGR